MVSPYKHINALSLFPDKDSLIVCNLPYRVQLPNSYNNPLVKELTILPKNTIFNLTLFLRRQRIFYKNIKYVHFKAEEEEKAGGGGGGDSEEEAEEEKEKEEEGEGEKEGRKEGRKTDTQTYSKVEAKLVTLILKCDSSFL